MNDQIEQLTTDIGIAIATTKSMVGQNPFADLTLGVIVDHLSRADIALCQLANAAKRDADAKMTSQS